MTWLATVEPAEVYTGEDGLTYTLNKQGKPVRAYKFTQGDKFYYPNAVHVGALAAQKPNATKEKPKCVIM
jgi:hypothetical protein